MQKILVLYTDPGGEPRKTMQDHIFSFERYASNAECHYCNVLYKLPFYLSWTTYDCIILHYSLLAMRWAPETWPYFKQGLLRLKDMNGCKIAIPQDENAHSADLCELFAEVGVDSVFSCGVESTARQFYPPETTGVTHYRYTFPGFVDEQTLADCGTPPEWDARPLDIGYRARDVPMWLGRHGRSKGEIGRVFSRFAAEHGLKADISTQPEDTIGGNKWLPFLQSCRFALGVSGGASLHDPEGKIRHQVETYLKQHPNASFEEVESACFLGKDGNLDYSAISPRHFEYAMAGCCQILLREDYGGVLQPDVHYIPVEKDFSNLDEVWQKMQDHQLCKQLVDNAHRDLVLSGKYTYAAFVERVQKHASEVCMPSGKISIAHRVAGALLRVRKRCVKPLQWSFWTWYKLRGRFPVKLPYGANTLLKLINVAYLSCRITYHGSKRLLFR